MNTASSSSSNQKSKIKNPQSSIESPSSSSNQKSKIHNPQSSISPSSSATLCDLSASTILSSLPQLHRTTRNGNEVILVPVFIEIPVDPLEGFTAEEAPRVALDRLAELSLEITLGGVPLEVQSNFPLAN